MLYVVITRAKIAINLFEIRMSVHFGVLEIQHGQWKVEWLEMSVSTLFAQWYTLSRPVLKLRQLPFWNIWNHFSPVLTLRSWQSAGLDNVTKKVYECLDIHLPAYAHRRTDTQTPYKTNHPTTLYGYGGKILYPIFSTSLKTEWARFARSLRFVRIKKKDAGNGPFQIKRFLLTGSVFCEQCREQ